MRKAVAGLLIGLCAAGIVLVLTNLDALHTVELKTYDWRLVRTSALLQAEGCGSTSARERGPYA